MDVQNHIHRKAEQGPQGSRSGLQRPSGGHIHQFELSLLNPLNQLKDQKSLVLMCSLLRPIRRVLVYVQDEEQKRAREK